MVELLLRALFEQGTLPEPALIDELMAVCAQPISDKHAPSGQRPATAEVAHPNPSPSPKPNSNPNSKTET